MKEDMVWEEGARINAYPLSQVPNVLDSILCYHLTWKRDD